MTIIYKHVMILFIFAIMQIIIYKKKLDASFHMEKWMNTALNEDRA